MAVRGCGAIPSLRDVQAASDAKALRPLGGYYRRSTQGPLVQRASGLPASAPCRTQVVRGRVRRRGPQGRAHRRAKHRRQ